LTLGGLRPVYLCDRHEHKFNVPVVMIFQETAAVPASTMALLLKDQKKNDKKG